MPATAMKTRWDGGNLVFLDVNGVVIANLGTVSIGVEMCKRIRVPIASINAGFELLPAIPGYGYRMSGMREIAVGGAVTSVTTVDILGTQSTSSVKLMAGAQASLTQSTVVTAGGSGGTVLADGASFAVCDVNTNITCNITGSAITVATNVDFLLSFAIQ